MVRSTFFGFTTALRSLSANQKALDVTGQNIGNLNTHGYTRQRLDLYSSVSGGYADKYASRNDSLVGQGVIIGGVSQVRDPFLDVRFRREANKLGEIDAKLSALKDLATIFDETTSDGLKAQMDDVVKQLQGLASNSGNAEFDGIVKSSMDVLTKLFNQYANQTDSVRKQQDFEMQDVTVPAVNELLKNISNLNKSIKEDQAHGNPALELMDQRNSLIDELSSYMNISVSNENRVEVSKGVFVSDLTINFLDGNNQPIGTLVSGEKSSEFSYSKNSDGKTIISISPPSNKLIETTAQKANDVITKLKDLNTKITGMITLPNTLESLQNQQKALGLQLKSYLPNATLTIPNGAGNAIVTTNDDNGTLHYLLDNANKQTQLVANPPKVTIGTGVASVTKQFTKIDVTDEFSTGIMKGALDMLNKSGEFDTPANTVRGIGYYEKTMDTLASKFANEFNDLNSFNSTNADKNPNFDPAKSESDTNLRYKANQTFLDANPGWKPGKLSTANPNGDLYPPGNKWKPLFADRNGNDPITAKGLSIAQGWLDSSYGITNSKNPIDGGSDTSGDATNVLAMIALFDKKIQFETPSGAKLFLGSFYEATKQTGTTVDLDLNSTEKIFKNYITVLNGVDDLRSGLSAVSLDEEGVNLLKFQKSYNAAARLMTTLDEAVDTIINRMGTVGR